MSYQTFDFTTNLVYSAKAKDPAQLYQQLRLELEQAIKSAQLNLQQRKIKPPYVHLNCALQILQQTHELITKAPTKQNYEIINQTLYRCKEAIYKPTDHVNLQQLKLLSKKLTGQPSVASQTLGVLLYTLASLLVVAGLLAAIPLNGGNVLMSLCLAAHFTSLAAAVVYSAATAMIAMGSGVVVAAGTYGMGFFSPHGLAGQVTRFTDKIPGTQPPMAP